MSFFVLSVILLISTSYVSSVFDLHTECNTWAFEDNQCIENPNFMWTSCLTSCISFANNIANDEGYEFHSKCKDWAAEGECEANPNFINLHCPVDCGLAVAWDPFTRRELQFSEIPFEPSLAQDNCGDNVSDVISAAEIIKERLTKYFSGGYNSVTGFSSASPSNYLNKMGLAEAVLYVLRLYEVVLAASDREDYYQSTVEKIQRVMEVVGSGYSSDLLARHMPEWMEYINQSSYEAHSVASGFTEDGSLYTSQSCTASYGPPLEDVLSHFQTPNASTYNHKDTITLLNGVEMPLLGLGTWQLDGHVCVDAVSSAIELGYRAIDTAEAYRNEKEVGVAVKAQLEKGTVSREQLFIATKLSDTKNAGYQKTLSLVKEQLELLQTTYIDLYMLHSPIGNRALQADTWRALEDLYAQGVIKALGVSNFGASELRELVESAQKVKPMVVQNKLDVYHVGKQLDSEGDRIMEYAKSQNIVVVSYSPFSAYPFVMLPINDPLVSYIAARHIDPTTNTPATPAQILLKWAMQKGTAMIPRSSNNDRLAENIKTLSIPPLTSTEIAMLDTLQYLVSSPVSKAVPF